MSKKLYVFLLLTLINIITTSATLGEILVIQNQLESSYNNIEKLLTKYKSKIQEQILKEKESTVQGLLKRELVACQNEKYALETLNKMYADQIDELQNKTNSFTIQLEEKDRQIDDGRATIDTFTTIINEQAKQIELLTEDNAVKSQIILNMHVKTKDIADKLNGLEDFRTKSSADSEIESSCLSFDDSEVHIVKPDDGNAFEVPCDSSLAGRGWTVVQRRLDGSVWFNRSWAEYEEGFGHLTGEFFIGLEKLHRITKAQPHELYVHLTDFNNETSHAFYDKILVAGKSEQYALSELGEYSGNAGDSMRDNEHQKFSTYDKDNDQSKLNCAEFASGGWWYNNCGLSNLNGRYKTPDDYYDDSDYGIYWDEWQGAGYTLKAVQIMVRPKTVSSDL